MKKNRWYEMNCRDPIRIEKHTTKAEKYCLPALGMQLSNLRMSVDKKYYNSEEILKLIGYFNTFLHWKDYPENSDNCCYILLYPSKWSFNNYIPPFIEYVTSLPTFRNYYLVDIRTIVIVLEIEKKWDFNVKKIVENGKYSKLSDKFAAHYFSKKEEAYRVIMKTETKKLELERFIGQELENNMEYDSISDRELETLKIDVKWDLEKEL